MDTIIDYRGKTPNKTSFGIPLITAKIVKDGKILTPNEFIDPNDYDEWMRRGLPEKGDIVLTTEAPLGEVAQLDGRKVALAQRIITLRGKKGYLFNTFLKYALIFAPTQDALHGRASGTTVTGIKQSELRKIVIPIPEYDVQKAIAHILGTLDDKIELNRRMNETLESIARAIFKSWFIDFDPVRAKAETRQPEGMDTATAALFPSEFETVEGQKIPKGWKIKSLDKMFKIVMGQSPPSSTYNEINEGVPFFQGKTDFGFRYPTVRVFCTAPTRFANPGDTLLSLRAPVGDVNISLVHSSIGRGIAALRHESSSRSFTYYALKSLYHEFIQYDSNGTVFGCLTKDSFKSLSFIQPPNELINLFEKTVSSLDSKIESNENSILLLSSIQYLRMNLKHPLETKLFLL
ncbi:restriction endonuclease subunit S [Methanospirillum hungatei]|uniref:restriction endonuclease subunit S n=1 Tax=Methanospirillum hungatei TaxID=2203 RepID=UPI0026F15285|nr:restriction endonuclease subunit S [Methanospirillum hungatei]MCA1917726.1 restriction endonuclease subunit S [Methanospirillum hungatei]